MYGRRRLYLAGLVVFTGASVLCGFATSTLMLQLSRGLQGAGGAIMFAVSLALLANAVFPGREARSRPSSWPGRSRPGQVERPARLTGERNLINPATAWTDMHSIDRNG